MQFILLELTAVEMVCRQEKIFPKFGIDTGYTGESFATQIKTIIGATAKAQ